MYVLVGGMQVKYTSVLKFLKEKSKNLGSNIRLKASIDLRKLGDVDPGLNILDTDVSARG